VDPGPPSVPRSQPEGVAVAASKGSQDATKKPVTKRTPNDFIFGKVIGEGSFSTVKTKIILM
jgi:hypothetical protein